MFFLSVLTGESFWLGITDCKKDLYCRVSDELCVFIWHFFGIKPKHALSYWHSGWLHSQQLECSKYQIVDGLERVTTNVYCLLCNIVQSKLQEEIEVQKPKGAKQYLVLNFVNFFLFYFYFCAFIFYVATVSNISLLQNAEYCTCVSGQRSIKLWLHVEQILIKQIY